MNSKNDVNNVSILGNGFASNNIFIDNFRMNNIFYE